MKTWQRNPLLLSLALLCLLSAISCAPKQPQVVQPAPPPPPEEVTPDTDPTEDIWQKFTSRVATTEIMSGPFRVSGALRYTDPEGKTNRVSSLLWGNNKPGAPWPLRLDLTAGIGQVVAKVRETKNGLLAFIPDENVAYVHEGGSRTLASFGVPVPLALCDLALLLTGRGGLLFLPSPASAEAPVPAKRSLIADGARYTLNGVVLAGHLTLSKEGVPLEWREAQSKGWVMEFEAAPENPLRPSKLRIKHGKGWSALITVKDITRVSPPYENEQLDLVLPPDVEKLPLEQ
ncbi:hypothetical protein LJC09_03885 [Desulfovibrio sp. OttesenSCG-928-F20]|nr:hypothetical protein [Desulfovibrio sp. OttesenSCG-928-F20]